MRNPFSVMEARQHPHLMHVMTHSVKMGHFAIGVCLFSWCLHTQVGRGPVHTKGTTSNGSLTCIVSPRASFRGKRTEHTDSFSFARERHKIVLNMKETDAGPIQPFFFWSLSNRQGKGWAGSFPRTMKTRREGTTLAETGALAFETLFGNLRLPTLFRRSLAVSDLILFVWV